MSESIPVTFEDEGPDTQTRCPACRSPAAAPDDPDELVDTIFFDTLLCSLCGGKGLVGSGTARRYIEAKGLISTMPPPPSQRRP